MFISDDCSELSYVRVNDDTTHFDLVFFNMAQMSVLYFVCVSLHSLGFKRREKNVVAIPVGFLFNNRLSFLHSV